MTQISFHILDNVNFLTYNKYLSYHCHKITSSKLKCKRTGCSLSEQRECDTEDVQVGHSADDNIKCCEAGQT